LSILSIDTSSAVSSVAVLSAERVAAEISMQGALTHSETLMPHIETAIRMARVEKSELEGIAVSIGPGSFTGLRIGLASAKMMAYALHIPLITTTDEENFQDVMSTSQAVPVVLVLWSQRSLESKPTMAPLEELAREMGRLRREGYGGVGGRAGLGRSHRFTDEDRAQAILLRQQGLTIAEIAKRLGFSGMTIGRHLAAAR